MSVSAKNLPKGRIRGAKWSGYPVEARLVKVLVGDTSWKWCVPYIGTTRRAIEVILQAGTIYIDNEDGRALTVFVRGQAPLPGFRLLPVYSVYEDELASDFYQADPI